MNKEMTLNTDQLDVGLIVKNYKELCVLLGESIKAGNSKKTQLKEWERYFDYEKQGNKFIITNIYDHPMDRIDLRHSKRTPYIDYIEELLISVLVNKKKLFLSRNAILKSLEMINDNYTYVKYNPHKDIHELINIDKEEIKDFYTTTDDLLKRNVESALDGLERKRLISWNKTITVCFINTSVETNELDRIKVTKHEEVTEDGDIIVSYDAAQPLTREIHRKATEEEHKLIWEVEKDILVEWDYDDISDVIKYNRTDEFYKIANKRLLRRGNINYYYYSYEILCNEKYILDNYNKLESLKLNAEKTKHNIDKLNAGIIDKIGENASNRHMKASETLLSKKNVKKIIKLRSLDNYLSNTNKLTETLIDNEAESIKPY